MARTAIGAALAILVAAGPAWSDEITLKSGRKVIGWAREAGDKVIVEIPLGTVAFSKEDVVSITPGRTVLHDYQDKVDGLAESTTAKEYLELAKWARENGLNRYVRENVDKALKLEPDNAEARREAGFTMYKGRWMTQNEVKADQGFVQFEGRWITPLEKELILSKRLDQQAKRAAELEERKRRKDEERAERERRLQDVRDEIAEIERLRQSYYEYRRYQYGVWEEDYLALWGAWSLINCGQPFPGFCPSGPRPTPHVGPAPRTGGGGRFGGGGGAGRIPNFPGGR